MDSRYIDILTVDSRYIGILIVGSRYIDILIGVEEKITISALFQYFFFC